MNRRALLAIAACLSLGATVYTSAGVAAERTLRLAHGQNPSDPVHTAAKKFAEIVDKETGGKVEVKIFPSSSLGSYEQLQEGLQQGSVDIVIESIGTLSRFHPAAGIESMPYLFRDHDHYVKIWNGPVGAEVKKTLAEDANFLVLGHMFRGARQLTSNKEVKSIKDLEGLKIRVSPMKERLITWQTFGANPTPMSWSEVFTALQQGVIDAQENPLATILSASLNEVQKYLVLTAHMANGFTFQFNAKRFNDLPPETQAAIRKAADGAAQSYNAFIAEEEDGMLKKLQEKGMKVIRVDREPFEAKAKDIVKQFPELESWYLKIANAK